MMNANIMKKCAGKDIFERINYLYQLSNVTLKKHDENVASSLYSNLLLNISKKAVLRLEPDIKRSICKKCHSLMVPGVSAKVRIKKKFIKWTCKRCSNSKSYKTNRGYRLWIDNPEGIAETLRY